MSLYIVYIVSFSFTFALPKSNARNNSCNSRFTPLSIPLSTSIDETQIVTQTDGWSTAERKDRRMNGFGLLQQWVT